MDILIGQRIRQRRNDLDLTQRQVADVLGITYQQFQKYENGQARIYASRLYRLAHEMQMPVAWFFGER